MRRNIGQWLGVLIVLTLTSCHETSNKFNELNHLCGLASSEYSLIQIVDEEGKPVPDVQVSTLAGEELAVTPKACFETVPGARGYKAADPGRRIAGVIPWPAKGRRVSFASLVLRKPRPLDFHLDCDDRLLLGRSLPRIGLIGLPQGEGLGHRIDYVFHRLSFQGFEGTEGHISLPYDGDDLLGEQRLNPWPEGTYQIHATHTDIFGQKRDVTQNRPCMFAIDRTPPSLDGLALDAAFPLGATIGLEAEGARAWRYMFNEGEWQPYQAPIRLDTEGIHNIRLKALDEIGNESPEKQFTFHVTNLPEAVTQQPSMFRRPGEELLITPFSKKVRYCLRQTNTESCSGQIKDWVLLTFPENRLVLPKVDGQYQLLLSYENHHGHRWPVLIKDVVVDGKPPVIELESPLVRTSSQGVNVSLSEDVTAVTCQALLQNSQDIVECQLEDGRILLPEGTWRIELAAYDHAGNEGRRSLTGVVIDDTPPDVSIFNPLPVYPIGHGMALTSDGQDRFLYGLSRLERSSDDCECEESSTGCQLTPYQGPVSLTESGDWFLTYCGIDQAGNASEVLSMLLKVDGTPPQISLSWRDRLPVDPFVVVDGMAGEFSVAINLEDGQTPVKDLQHQLQCRVSLVQAIDGVYRPQRGDQIYLGEQNIPLGDWQYCGAFLNQGALVFHHKIPPNQWEGVSLIFEARTKDSVGLKAQASSSVLVHRAFKDRSLRERVEFPLENIVELSSGVYAFGPDALLARRTPELPRWEVLAEPHANNLETLAIIGETSGAVYTWNTDGTSDEKFLVGYRKPLEKGKVETFSPQRFLTLAKPWIMNDQVWILNHYNLMSLNEVDALWDEFHTLASSAHGIRKVVYHRGIIYGLGVGFFWTTVGSPAWQELSLDFNEQVTDLIAGPDGQAWVGSMSGTILRGGASGFLGIRGAEDYRNPVVSMVTDRGGRIFALRSQGDIYHHDGHRGIRIDPQMFDSAKPFKVLNVIDDKVYASTGEEQVSLEGTLGMVKFPLKITDHFTSFTGKNLGILKGQIFTLQHKASPAKTTLFQWRLGAWVPVADLPYEVHHDISCGEHRCIMKAGKLWTLTWSEAQGVEVEEMALDFVVPQHGYLTTLTNDDLWFWNKDNLIKIKAEESQIFGLPQSPLSTHPKFKALPFNPSSSPMIFDGRVHVGGQGGVWVYEASTPNFTKLPFNLNPEEFARSIGVKDGRLYLTAGAWDHPWDMYEWSPLGEGLVDLKAIDSKIQHMMPYKQGMFFWAHERGYLKTYSHPRLSPVGHYRQSFAPKSGSDYRDLVIFRQASDLLIPYDPVQPSSSNTP